MTIPALPRRCLRRALLAGALALAGAAHAQSTDPAAIARQALDLMDAGDYAQVEALFTPRMAAAVPAGRLKAVWESLPAQMGKATGRGDATVAAQGEAAVVQVPLHFEQAELVARFAIDADGRIAGFLVQPAQAAPAPAPAVAADAPYTEREMAIGDGARALPATLAMPKGGGPFPAIVLVHGSGPHDRDETIGPNKPFLDLARGLAAQGIAVLRYEKRTKAHPEEFAGGDFGVDDETTFDAVLAVDALRKTAGIDPKRIFVLGHSQGGMMAPRIAALSGHVKGLVLLAAPARPLLDIVVEQNRRMAVLDDGKISDAERAAINALIAQVRQTRDPATPAATRTVMGQPAGYWRSIDAVDPVAEAQRVALPMLVLQGARDIQVVDADWQAWRAAFDGDPKVAFKLYPALNHLGIPGEGEGTLAEYQQPGHVDPTLVDDVAAWVKAH
ncbi:alpha/beta fold hydrolase [Thermomonas sp. S9]|uniref:alpha/beta hydrolase n=1 Tax=Thermomonas sp. S9 TaxID=2885203 RepID=UPI00216AE04A|nr:alpha/beta fold hydrolase [Thermomonas sp. S9]MCR6495795.1 alpha/beta fold hydrolase [Thermomonas sp. S9]